MEVIRLLDKHPSLVIVVLIIAFGIAGSMDYADEKIAEANLCKHNPKPEFCSEVIK